ncbi:MAG TPA: protein kinase [Gemmataceae bacterium]|nr:protein kinase [Gemmataceae bacterium]
MAITELGACEWFVWDLRRSNLIDRGHLDQLINEFLKKQPNAEPPALAQFLVNHGILSQFQAERLLQGKTQGLVLGPYTLIDALGSGSMGTVYKAFSKNDGKWYAVKVLPRRSMWNVRIARRQVRLFDQCKHPSVVPFVDVGTAGGTHYLAWPLVEGEGLDHLVQREGKLPPGLSARIGMQAAEGLDICHRNNLVHGLLKPSNLMMGTDNQVRILDFGIGSLLAESEGESLVDTMSTANSLTSGLDCASPESIMDPTQRTPAGDQYSLGCVLYFCLTGQYPFPEGTAVEKMMAHQTKQPPAIKDVSPETPDELVAVVDRLMQKAPAARYGSVADAMEALRPLASESPEPGSKYAAQPIVQVPPNGLATLAPEVTRPAPAPSRPAVAASTAAPARPTAVPPAPPSAPPLSTRPAAMPASTQAMSARDRLLIPSGMGADHGAMPSKYAVENLSDPPKSLDERLGTTGMVIAALAMAVVAFLVFYLFMNK